MRIARAHIIRFQDSSYKTHLFISLQLDRSNDMLACDGLTIT